MASQRIPLPVKICGWPTLFSRKATADFSFRIRLVFLVLDLEIRPWPGRWPVALFFEMPFALLPGPETAVLGR